MNIDKYEFPNLKPFDQDANWSHKYCYDVINDVVPACENIKLAANRHFSDLERDDIYWCEETANSIVSFFKFVPITDGKDVGKPTVLLPWQIWVVASMVSWRWAKDTYDDDGNPLTVKGERRFLQAVVLISRKAGKTTIAAGVVLWLMLKAGHQPRAYCVATKRDQAKLLWETAKIMIKLSPRLKAKFDGRANDILMPSKDGVFKPLASDSNSLDGLNPIAIVGDEGHSWKDDNLYNVSVSSFGAQTEYMMLMISTAGFLLDNILVTLIKNGERVLRGDATQDHFFYAIFQIDKDDDWTDINALYKANAGMIYGLPSVRYIRNQLSEAKMNVVQKANFLTKHANLFVNSSDTWLNFDDVVKCSNPELDFNDYKDKKCFVGVDRALVGDITSCVPLFPDDDGGCTIFPFNMQSKGAFDEAGDYLRSIYMKAEDSDDLEIINGNTVRNTDVKELIRYLWNELTQCEGFYYDPYHMKEVAMELESEGIPMIAVSQGTGNMAEPSLKLESLIKEGLFRYNGSTLFEFGVSCAQVGITKNNNMHVYRDTSSYKTEKIDPLIATIIALSGATLTKQDEFCYNDRGMLFL